MYWCMLDLMKPDAFRPAETVKNRIMIQIRMRKETDSGDFDHAVAVGGRWAAF